MAKIANNNCKKIYVTDDNPRKENPQKIRYELLRHISRNKVFETSNRALAIKKAIKNAHPHETILIAGKGHEEKQIYKNKIYYASDKKIIKKNDFKTKILTKKYQNFFQNRLILENILGKIHQVNFNGLSIDTRKFKRDNLFLAIKGKKNDGSKFINKALKKGAGCILSSSIPKKYNRKIIKINNTISFE